MEKTVRLVLEKTTKGALRYVEVGDDGREAMLIDATIGTLYIRKSAMAGQAPTVIDVTIRSA